MVGSKFSFIDVGNGPGAYLLEVWCGFLFIVLLLSQDGEGGSFLSMVSFTPVGPFSVLFLIELQVCRAEPFKDMGPTAMKTDISLTFSF